MSRDGSRDWKRQQYHLAARALLAAALLASVALGAACSAPAPAPTASGPVAPAASTATPNAPAAAGKTKLVLWVHAAEPFLKAHREIVDLYAKENPNVEIEIQSYPWADYPTKIAAALPSGTGPDVMEAYTAWMVPYVRKGLLSPVPDSVATTAQMAERYYAASLPMLQFNGKYYAIPSNVDSSCPSMVLINDSIVKEAGVNLDDNKTFDDWMADWKTLTKVDSSGKVTRAGLGVASYQPPYVFGTYIMQYGGSVLDETGHKAALNSEAGRKALQMLADLVKKYKVDSADLTDFSSVGQGTAAMTYRGSWFVPVLLADFPDLQWHFALVPPPPGATAQVWDGGSGWSTWVPAASKKQEEAWKFVKFLEEHRGPWIKNTSEMPANKALAAQMAKDDPKLFGTFYQILEQGKPAWTSGDFFKIYDTLQNMVTSVWMDQATVDQALASAETEINTHLTQWWAQFGQ